MPHDLDDESQHQPSSRPKIDTRWIKGLSRAEASARGEYGVQHMSKTRAEWAVQRLAAKEAESGNPAVEAALQSTGFEELRCERVLSYDPASVPIEAGMREMVAAVLPRVAELGLAKLHIACDPNFDPAASFKSTRKKFNGNLYWSPAGATLRNAYRQLIEQVIAPHVGDTYPCDRVVFQAEPALRIQPPSTPRIGFPHTDSIYFHQRGQVNFWIPATATFGSNSLWAESAPCRGDYHPFEAWPGQIVRFYGNQCVHFTLPNETFATRVSLDARAVPGPCFDPDPPEARRDGRPLFQVGGYYAEALRTSDGTWAITPGTMRRGEAPDDERPADERD